MPHIMSKVPDHSIRVSIDRGGTFADCWCSWRVEGEQGRKEKVFKLLSSDPGNYEDAPTEACRRVLEHVTGDAYPRGTKLPTQKIEYIRLSTTVATNALLERKGAKHAFVVTKGFRDLLRIGNQSRPDIFALNIQRPEVLFDEVLEIDERVTIVGYTSNPRFAEEAVKFDESGKVTSAHKGDIVQGVSGEAVEILRKPDSAKIRADLQALFDRGIRCIAICLAHSYTFPQHEQIVADIAQEIGFTQISVSSALSPQIKMVPRGTSASADAYLSPVLKEYIAGFFKGFEDDLKRGKSAARVEFMTSEGTLVEVANFSGLRSVISGPAGGVVGCAKTSWDEERQIPVIGFDMGGTSTDCSRYAGQFETVFESTTAGVSLFSPSIDVNTVAAGGGSLLTFKNGLFNSGPHSAGSHPGPVCYRKGGSLAVTDANLVLGRLSLDHFPKIFGKTEDQPLDLAASVAAFEVLRQEINTYNVQHGTGKELSIDEVAIGFIKVANEVMARPVRSLTEARGFKTSSHLLAAFGGAGGQHACELAKNLGITKIIIHQHSSILSAYGMALSNRAYEQQEPCATEYNESSRPSIMARIERLSAKVKAELQQQGFEDKMIEIEPYLNMRYDGSDTSIMTLAPLDGSFDYHTAFETAYREEFGFLLDSKSIMVDDIRIRGIGKSHEGLGESTLAEADRLEFRPVNVELKREQNLGDMYFEETGRMKVPIFLLENLQAGELVQGPAALLDGTQSIILTPDAVAKICSRAVYIELS